MAGTTLYASLLPAITCSTCGASVNLSMLGDHICTPPTPSKAAEPLHRTDSERLPAAAEPSKFREQDRADIPQSDRDRAHERDYSEYDAPQNQQYDYQQPPPQQPEQPQQQQQQPPVSLRQNSRPAPSSPSRQPVNGALNAHGAAETLFPEQRQNPLPPPQPQSAFAPPPRQRQPPRHLDLFKAQNDTSLAPKSPQMMGGGNLLQRMGSIAPGPFDTRHRKAPSKDQTADKPLGLFRRKSSKHLSREETKAMISDPIPNVPTLSARYSGKMDGDGKPLPGGPAPPRPSRPIDVEGFVDQLRTSVMSGSSMSQPDTRPPSMAHPPAPYSNTSNFSSPEMSQGDSFRTSQSTSDDDTQPSSRTWSGTSWSSNPRSPTVNSMHSHGLPQINENEEIPVYSDKKPPPPAWSSGRSVVPPRPSPPGQQDRSALPHLNTSQDYFNTSNKHTTAESFSSSDSRSVWDERSERSGSSRSSPPTSTTSTVPNYKPTYEESNVYNTNDTMSPTSGTFPRGAANFSRPRAPTTGDDQTQLPPGPSLQPTVYVRPQKQQKTATDAVESPASALTPPPGFDDKHASTTSSTRSGGAKSKGNCRGCGLDIIGKSIKAADGRLTGRWHKECFVCKACHVSFPTMDFYIFGNEPYCAFHYHELNRSLCQVCNHGIEGHYVAGDGTLKYHLDCFTCHGCKKPLTRDYFEIDGKRYCETDARIAHKKSQYLAPGKRFPERRTTRLMMM